MSAYGRRRFLKNTMNSTIGVSALGTFVGTFLSGCSTLDEYLFEDPYDLKDQVLIIGGGLSGLYAAYKLKQNKIEFRLLEGASRFGGRIQSYMNYDLGASLFSQQDENVMRLLKEMSLKPEKLDKKNLFLSNGMQTLIDGLVERTKGLMPYRQLRLQWQATQIRKVSNYYEVEFQTPSGKRSFLAKKIILAVPPTQWTHIQGLTELDEMKQPLLWQAASRYENIMKVVMPTPLLSRSTGQSKKVIYYNENEFQVRQINKKSVQNNQNWTEVDFQFSSQLYRMDIQKINDYLKNKMNLAINSSKLNSESYQDWSQAKLIGAGAFKSALEWKDSSSLRFHVVGDFATQNNVNRMEGALSSVIKVTEKLI